MSTPREAPSDESLRFERACEWFMELREKLHSPQAVAEWLEWCSADPRNRDAFEQARKVWTATAGADEKSLGLRSPTRARNGRLALAGVGAALAAGIAAIAFFASGALHAPDARSVAVLTTRVGENRQVSLGDGSTVVLGGGSQVVAQLDARARRLTLESGEAYFKVARDEQRPFIVSAGPVRVTALGTEFNVRTVKGRVVVAVAQGVVQIDAAPRDTASAPSRGPLRAAAGETIALDTIDASMQLAHADPVNMASWREGRLEFAREPLSAVLNSINRNTGRRISLGSAELGELRFTGTVFIDRLDDWIGGLPQIFPVAVREDAGGVAIVAESR